MANLYFPQLTSGALAQYPIRKIRQARTIKNVLADGSMILFPDPDGARAAWQLSYRDLSANDAEALQAHFNACGGPFHAFTFIDPTENMLAASSDLTAAVWQASSLIRADAGSEDPRGGVGGFSVTNTGQSAEQMGQSFDIPAWYQYCFSLYATSAEPSTLTLIRTGSSAAQSDSYAIGPSWTRIVSSGVLNDMGTSFSVAIRIAAGQQVELYGPQLEAQIAPSRYRPTGQAGGVYSSAHWAIDELTITAEAPNLFATSLSIETAI